MKIAIIGAGLSAIVLAQRLQTQHEVLLFEKARGAGGRLSTRRASPFAFDHGAQYFTVRDPHFDAWLDPLKTQQLIIPWFARSAAFNGSTCVLEKDWSHQPTRFVAVPGMNAMVKAYAKDLSIQYSTHIVSLEKNGATWSLHDKQGQSFHGFDWVISTAPPPQTQALFPSTFLYQQHLKQLDMHPCYALLLGLKEPLSCPFDVAFINDLPLKWIALNHHKPQRPSAPSLVIHAAYDFSEEHLHTSDEIVRSILRHAAESLLQQDLTHTAYESLHLWRYAAPKNTSPTPCMIDPHTQLACCGDWAQGGRVEGAFLAATKLADDWFSVLNQ